jgi:Kef-type K+ transport system membrane component KefB
VSTELVYMLLVLLLFVVARGLQRFRIPSAISAVVLGAVLNLGFNLFHEDATVIMLATLGIVAMFLFAGLEVDFSELRRGQRVLLQHISIQAVVLVLVAWGLTRVTELPFRAALLFALAVLTPSTGFILDSLGTLGLSEEERFWVKSKAIAQELVALAVLFFAVQSDDGLKLSLSAAALTAMVLVLPPLFRVFDRFIAPFAPKTEFTFLVIVALLCSLITRELGVYYLVGAFVVGLTAVRLRKSLPALSSERLLGAVELFASFFIPFYFFKAGLHLRAEFFTFGSVALAVGLLVVVLPARVLRVALHRKLALGEPLRVGARVGVAVLPTLVFTIVLAEILQERFALSPTLFGALIMYALVNTLVPSLVMRTPALQFDRPEVPRAAVADVASPSAPSGARSPAAEVAAPSTPNSPAE